VRPEREARREREAKEEIRFGCFLFAPFLFRLLFS
jgi:hypothetical protein